MILVIRKIHPNLDDFNNFKKHPILDDFCDSNKSSNFGLFQ